MRGPVRLIIIITIAAAIGAISSSHDAIAQLTAAQAQELNQVYVRDSSIALEKFALAERMQSLREWHKAADIYQEVLLSYADRVVPSVRNQQDQILQYTSVVSSVQERLAKWPAEGLAAYRTRYDVEAQGMLDGARPGDLSTLHRVNSTYFVTDAGRIAGTRLVDAQLEAGEFAAAAWTAQRLLDLHPDVVAPTSPHRAMLLYRAALASHLAGDDKQANAKLDDLKKDFPDALGRVRGQDTRLADALQSELSTPTPAASISTNDSWPMPYGSPDRARVPRTVNSIGANLYRIDLARMETASPRLGISPQDGQSDMDRRAGYMTGVLPVIDRGEMYFQDNSRIYAVSLESGIPLPGWAQTYDGVRGGRYVAAGALPTPRGQLCTLALTDNAVLAVMGMSDVRMQYAGAGGRRDTRVVCLDRRTGAERWVTRPAALADAAPPAVATALRELDFSGSPLVVGDNVYVMGRGSKGMQFEDCYVFCLDLDSGKSKWMTYVASANIAGMFFDESFGMSQQSVSHLAYASGRVFCLTNLGAVAAINAYDGTMAWLNIYPREVQDYNRFNGFRQQPVPRRPWSFNPVIVSDQHVFVLPGDGKMLHVYDAGSGKEIRSFGTLLRTDPNRLNEAQVPMRETINMIIGVPPAAGNELVIGTDRSVMRVDWLTFDPMNDKPVGIKWKKTFNPPNFAGGRDPAAMGRDGSAMTTIRGRPFLSADSVFVPTAWQLQTIALRNGASSQAYPPDRAWSDEEQPGNVLATNEYLVIAGPSHVTVYTDMDMAQKRLDAAISAAPTDPDPRLRYAEVMFTSRKTDIALAKLDEAIQLLGGRQAMAPGANRERVFSDALTFAQKLARPGGGAAPATEQTSTINSLFDRALDAAQTPSQHLNLRLSRADYANSVQDPATELRMYHEILASPEMRSITVARGEAGMARQAALIARQGVTDILARAGGRTLYEPYEKQAAAMLEANRIAGDPTKLLEIAVMYPNSTASRTASMLAAESLESAGNSRQAVQALRQLYFRLPGDAPERLRIVEALARNYLAIPNHFDVAAARLAQAAKLAGSNPSAKLSRPLRLPDGQLLQDVTFTQALEAVHKVQSRVADRALPDLHLPTDAAGNAPAFKPVDATPVINGVSALCVPLRDFTRNDRIVAYAPADGLAVYAVGADKPKYTSNVLAEGPKAVAWTGGNLLVWDRTTIAMIDDESGQIVWKMALSNLPAAETLAGAGVENDVSVANDVPANGVNGAVDINVNARLAQQGQMQIIVNGQRRRNIRFRGGPMPQQAGAGVPAAAAPVGPEQVVGVQPLSDRVVLATTDGRVVMLDLAEGKLLWQSRAIKAPIEKIVANDDFVAIKSTDASYSYLFAMESAQGQPVFRWKLNARDASNSPSLLNLALASDGTLVWVMPDRVAGKDLFEPGDVLRFGDAPLAAGVNQPPLLMAGGTDQFVVADGRILAVADSGANVWVMSLDQGVMLRGSDGAEMRLSTRCPPTSESNPQMRVVGSMLHIASDNPTRIVTYDLNQPGWYWDGKVVEDRNLKQVLVARDQMVVMTERLRRKPGAMTVTAFSRKPERRGLVESEFEFVEPTGVMTCQAVEGGIYYLAGDQRLHFLAGAGK